MICLTSRSQTGLGKEETQWKKGVSGNPGGRPKHWVKRVDETLKKFNFDPVAEILKVWGELTAKDKAHIGLELLSYCRAKPKEDPAPEEDTPDLSIREMVLTVLKDNPKLLKEANESHKLP